MPDYRGPHDHVFKFKIHPSGRGDRFFIKTEYLPFFLEHFEVKHDFELFTHNSDIDITAERAEPIFNAHPHITGWYAQNVSYIHPKLHPIPIGIANPKWAHGDQEIMEEAVSRAYPKTNDVYINFDLWTNIGKRQYCLDQLGVDLPERMPFKDHLKELASSLFCVSPDGNGVDCHRHWEALYLKTVPIVTRSVFTTLLEKKSLPLLIIDDWSDFKNLDLNMDLYKKLTDSFEWASVNSLFSCGA